MNFLVLFVLHHRGFGCDVCKDKMIPYGGYTKKMCVFIENEPTDP